MYCTGAQYSALCSTQVQGFEQLASLGNRFITTRQLKYIPALLNLEREISFDLVDVLIEPSAEIGQSLGVVWQESQTFGKGRHAGKK